MSNRFKRLTDLFTEGQTCFLGDNLEAKPECLYIQKLSSFEDQEAREDGLAARTEKLVELSDNFHPEIVNITQQLEKLSNEELIDARLNQKYEEIYMGAGADVEADPEWKDKLEYLRRGPEILNDASVSEDDPRRKQLADYNKEHLEAYSKHIGKRKAKMKEELGKLARVKIVEDYLDDYKDKLSVDTFYVERKVTQIYYATRDCSATREEPADEFGWNHSNCDHRNKLCESRFQVRELPQHVLDKITETMEALTVGYKTLGK